MTLMNITMLASTMVNVNQIPNNIKRMRKKVLSWKFNIPQNNVETCSSVLNNDTRFTIFSGNYKCQNFATTYSNEISKINFNYQIWIWNKRDYEFEIKKVFFFWIWP